MTKNIVICCDGTGNRGGVKHGTNVWRIFKAVDHHCCQPRQITYHDDGVGTEGNRLLRLFGGIFGWGLSRNIREAYQFLAMNYEDGDKVFLFGFSRGAFTVRSLAGMIGRCGLIEKEPLINAGSHRCRQKILKRILHAYRSTKTVRDCKKDNSKSDWKKEANCIREALGIGDLKLRSICIKFIGVWDTVDAVGMPIDKLKCAPELVMRVLFQRRAWGFHDHKLHRCVRHACQALALDDERKTFFPNIWESHPRIEQVWFAGAHSNAGGGYPKDFLSFVSLDWMMGKAKAKGLRFKHRRRKKIQRDANAHGRMYDSRAGFGMFYRFGRRNSCIPPAPLSKCTNSARSIVHVVKECFRKLIDKQATVPRKKPLVHISVEKRIRRVSNYYAPKNLCCEYELAYTDCGPYAECHCRSQQDASDEPAQ